MVEGQIKDTSDNGMIGETELLLRPIIFAPLSLAKQVNSTVAFG